MSSSQSVDVSAKPRGLYKDLWRRLPVNRALRKISFSLVSSLHELVRTRELRLNRRCQATTLDKLSQDGSPFQPG